jgi:hypothetical protein
VSRDQLEIAGTRHDGARLDAGWTRAIEFVGLEIPLLALPDRPNVVVLGARRARAVRAMRHFEEVPVYVAPTSDALDAWCVADEEVAKRLGAGAPWTWRQRGELLDLAMQAYRGYKKGPPDALAAYFGVHESQLRHTAYLLRLERGSIPAVQADARAAIELIERGELQPQSAYRKVRKGEPVAGRAERAAARDATVPAAQQVKVLRSTIAALAGMKLGLDALGNLSPDITDAERQELAPSITEMRALFARLARQLNTNKGDLK